MSTAGESSPVRISSRVHGAGLRGRAGRGLMLAMNLTAAEFGERLRGLRSADGSLPMREIFKLAKEYAQLPPAEIEKLLDGATHEERVGAVSVMGHQAQRKQTTPD